MHLPVRTPDLPPSPPRAGWMRGNKHHSQDCSTVIITAAAAAIAAICFDHCHCCCFVLPLLLQDMMSSEQLQKLAELRKQRANAPQPSSNIVQVREVPLCRLPQRVLHIRVAGFPGIDGAPG